MLAGSVASKSSSMSTQSLITISQTAERRWGERVLANSMCSNRPANLLAGTGERKSPEVLPHLVLGLRLPCTRRLRISRTSAKRGGSLEESVQA